MESEKLINNIHDTPKERIVIIGGGFAGLEFVKKLCKERYQLVLIDKNNYHQFQPLLYQVSTAGLEPGAVSFPLRKFFQKYDNVHFRMAEVLRLDTRLKKVHTDIGSLHYDYLVLATGAMSNFFGQKQIEQNAMPMKSITDAIYMRNYILQNLEWALNETEPEKIKAYMNIAIVGGGPTGVELAGALAEMKKYVFNKDYPELDLDLMEIKVFQGAPRLLPGMSESAAEKALAYLRKMGVNISLKTRVLSYDGEKCELSDGACFRTKTLIWAAGVLANSPEGIEEKWKGRSARILVDAHNTVEGHDNIYALGDVCLMKTPAYPNGHPQMAQVALQQARLLAHNFMNMKKGKALIGFEYRNKGSMATVGRNLAVADLKSFTVKGLVAWVLWSTVHLISLIGTKNKLSVLINWSWRYITYDQSLRLLIKHKTSNT